MGALAEPAYTLADVDPKIAMHRSECALDTSGTQSGERRDSASIDVRDLETELM
jgi:hypothetical protein